MQNPATYVCYRRKMGAAAQKMQAPQASSRPLDKVRSLVAFLSFWRPAAKTSESRQKPAADRYCRQNVAPEAEQDSGPLSTWTREVRSKNSDEDNATNELQGLGTSGPAATMLCLATAQRRKRRGAQAGARAAVVSRISPHMRKRQRRQVRTCLLYTSPSPRDGLLSRMPSSA